MENQEKKYYPNNLRKARLSRNLRQKDVAFCLGIESTSQIAEWENGTCTPNLDNIFKLSILYRTLPEALFLEKYLDLKTFVNENFDRLTKISS